jgi:MFS family permease
LKSIKNGQREFFYGYVIVVVAFGFGALAWGSLRTYGVFLEPLISEFYWTRATISLAFTVCMVVIGMTGIFMGRLSDRIGPRGVMMVSGVFLGAGYLLMAFTGALWQLYMCYGVMVAVGVSGVVVPMTSAVARWFVRRRGLMTGLVVAGPGFGITIVPLIVSWLISGYGWRTSYIVMGVAVLVLITLAAQLMKRDPSQVGEQPYGEEEERKESRYGQDTGFSLREALRSRQFWMLSMVSFGNFFNINVVMVHIVIHATGSGISPIAAVSVLSTTAAVSIAGRIVAGGAADRIGKRRTMAIGLGLTLFAFIWLLAGKEVWMFYLFAVIFGVGGWAVASVTSPMVAELFGMGSHGVILGAVIFGGTVGGAVGPFLAGYLFDMMGSYQLAFIVCGILSVVGTALISVLRPTRSRGG